MDYRIDVIFASSTRSPAFTFTDFFGEADRTFAKYWDDLAELMAYMIADAECMFRKLYPDGHDYSLSKVNISYVGDEKE